MLLQEKSNLFRNKIYKDILTAAGMVYGEICAWPSVE